eukprot:scaffold40430_cov26-Prasinocladus_malaysianus.AAC.5
MKYLLHRQQVHGIVQPTQQQIEAKGRTMQSVTKRPTKVEASQPRPKEALDRMTVPKENEVGNHN